MGIPEAIVRASGTVNALGPALITALGALCGIVVSVLFDRKRPGRHEEAPDREPTPEESPDRDDIADSELHQQLLNRATQAEAREASCARELTAVRASKTKSDTEARRRYDDFLDLAHTAAETSGREISRLREMVLKLGYDPTTGDKLEGR